jgi:hypothetical protein
MCVVRNRGLAMWILGLALSVSAAAQQRMLWQGVVKPEAINVYQSASTNELVTATLHQGDAVDVVLQVSVSGSEWCRVARAGTSEPLGFVLCLNLELGGASSQQVAHAQQIATQLHPLETAAVSHAPSVPTQLTNKDVLDLHKAGLPEQVLVAKIKSSQINFDTSPSQLKELKAAGLPDAVILAMVEAPVGQPKPSGVADAPDVANASNSPSPTTMEPAQPMAQNASAMNRQLPRVFLQSASHGNTWNARRDQSMEMSKDFQKVCPGVRVTLNQQMADYTVLLNHIELGLLARDNQMEIADRNGDLLQTKEGGSIKGSVKKVCDLILANWTKQ